MRFFSATGLIFPLMLFVAFTATHCKKDDKPIPPPQDSWQIIASTAKELNEANWSFIIGKQVFFGSAAEDLRIYDLDKKEWTGTFNYPAAFAHRWNCNVAVHNNKAYIGGGRSGTGPLLSDWWEFDPAASNPWKRLPDCPVAGADGTAFVWNQVLYTGLNIAEAGPTIQDRLYAFNIPNQQWTGAFDKLRANCGTSGFSFVLNDQFYFGAGYNNSIPGSLITQEAATFYMFGRQTQKIAPFPVELTSSENSRSFVYNQKGYVLGKNRDLYEYDPVRNKWRTMNAIPEESGKGHITYVHNYNNKIYGFTNKGYLYEYKYN